MREVNQRIRTWAWNKLVHLADRVSPHDAFRRTSGTFTFERHRGIVFHYPDGPGCPVWYYGPDYTRAHDEAEAPA